MPNVSFTHLLLTRSSFSILTLCYKLPYLINTFVRQYELFWLLDYFPILSAVALLLIIIHEQLLAYTFPAFSIVIIITLSYKKLTSVE